MAERQAGGDKEARGELNFDQLPNVFIIGAAKSGTTSLFTMLSEHPSVYAPTTKEIRFFSRDDRFPNGLLWYQETYYAAARRFAARLDATPAYLTWSHKVAPRIKAAYGERPVQFIAIFRDPVKRAYSHYWHRVRQGDEDPRRLSFAEAIHSEEKRLTDHWQRLEFDGNGLFGYFRAGCYATRLKPFLDAFPREHFFFLLQEDLQVDSAPRMSQLARFLGISERYRLRPLISNESVVPRSHLLLRLYRNAKQSALRGMFAPVFPKRIRRWIRGEGLMKRFQYPPMDEAIRQELYERYADEVSQLQGVLGRDLSHWRYTESAAPAARAA